MFNFYKTQYNGAIPTEIAQSGRKDSNIYLILK